MTFLRFITWLTDPARSAYVNLIVLVIGIAFAMLLAILGRVPLRYNLRNLQVRWRTTLMTALAFTLVIGLMTGMLAFVNGMYKLTQQSGDPTNVMILSDGATDEAFSNLGFSDVGDIELHPAVVRDAQRGVPLCSKETYISVNMQILDDAGKPVPGRPARRIVQLRGIDDPLTSSRVHNLSLMAGGTWFSREGVAAQVEGKQSAIQAVIGEGIARELAKDRSAAMNAAARNPERLEVGDTFRMGDRQWRVVGIFHATGSVFDSEIWAKRDVVGPLFGENVYSTLVLKAADASGAKTLKDFFNNEFTKASVQAIVETDYYARLAQGNLQFLIAIIFITVVMSIGGIFGVMNTMFAAVSQRVRDIGVLRILGYSRLEVLSSFLLESLVLAILGGSIGCALGSLAHGLRATSVVGVGPGTKFVVLELFVDASTLGIGLIVTLSMGLLGGLIPSLRAMWVRPLESMR